MLIAMGERTWDYLGWKKFNPPIEIGVTQRDWNQTLITGINQLSAIDNQLLLKNNIFYHDKPYINKVKINESLLELINDFEYTVINDGVITIGERYKVEIDNQLPKDEILVVKEYENKKTLTQSVLKVLNYE